MQCCETAAAGALSYAAREAHPALAGQRMCDMPLTLLLTSTRFAIRAAMVTAAVGDEGVGMQAQWAWAPEVPPDASGFDRKLLCCVHCFHCSKLFWRPCLQRLRSPNTTRNVWRRWRCSLAGGLDRPCPGF